MRVPILHQWDLSPAEAIALQRDLSHRLVTCNQLGDVRTVAGVDISTAGGTARAAIVVLSWPQLEPVEVARAELPLTFPYVPGLLAFREAPAILLAAERLCLEPDLFVLDGQGLAHPRRMGIASHVGIILDRPSIGCAKSLLCGRHQPVGPRVGDHAEITDCGEVIGVALRTREDTKPMYVSIGHRIDLPTAIHHVLRCTAGHRLPEPTRWAHRVAGGGDLPSLKVAQARLI